MRQTQKRTPLLIALIVVIVALLGAPTVAARQPGDWIVQPLGTGVRPALALDAEDTVHVAFLTEAEMGGVFYANSNETSWWNAVEVAQGYFYGPVDIAVNADGFPIITYHDQQAADFDSEKGDAVVVALGPDGWNQITVEHPGPDGWDTAITIDAEGFWHMSSIAPMQFGADNGLEYATNKVSTGTPLKVETLDSGPIPHEFATSIAVREDGAVGIAYFAAFFEDLGYAQRSPDGDWTITLLDEEGDVGRYAALVFDGEGQPHITYVRKKSDTSGTVLYTTRDAAGEWHTETIGTLNNIQAGHAGARKITAVAVDSQGRPVVAYTDQSRLVLARKYSDGWESETLLESSPETGTLGQLVELALDSQDMPHLVTYTVDGPDPQPAILYLAQEID